MTDDEIETAIKESNLKMDRYSVSSYSVPLGALDIEELVEEWHETKSLATAAKVCELIWEDMNGRTELA